STSAVTLRARIRLESDIRMFPVPSNNFLTLQSYGGTDQINNEADQLSVFDVTGRRVIFLRANELKEMGSLRSGINLDTSDLTNGVM
ncbi:T9SS type A sorting domain-containing protein, partial [Aureicoccus marinus]